MGEARRRRISGDTMGKAGWYRTIKHLAGPVIWPPTKEDVMLMVKMHFPESRSVDDLDCEDCVDKAVGVCDGRGLKGEAVLLKCFTEKMVDEVVIEAGSQ